MIRTNQDWNPAMQDEILQLYVGHLELVVRMYWDPTGFGSLTTPFLPPAVLSASVPLPGRHPISLASPGLS